MDLQKIGGWIQAMGGTKWLIAQVLSLIGYTLMVITGYIKKEKKMLRTQDVQLIFIIASTLKPASPLLSHQFIIL